MVPLPDGRVFLRWMFAALGLGTLAFPHFVVRSLLRAPYWAAFFRPGDPGFYSFIMGAAYVYAVLTLLLCMTAFFGLKLEKAWGRWMGAAVSALLLVGFPLLTAAGVIGLYAMFAKPLPTDPRSGSAPPPRAPRDAGGGPVAQPFIAGIAMILGFQALALLTLYAQRNGMPASNPNLAWWGYFLFFLLLQVALHELGHAALAWTVYFRVRVLAIGPFTFWNDGWGIRFRLEWKRLLDRTGYLGAVPLSEADLLLKQTAVIAGGPLMSLVTGGLFLLAFLALPGTGWESSWLILAFNAVLGLGCGVMSLLPIGNSDGVMLYHLLRDTPAGRHLLRRARIDLLQEAASAAHCRADFQKEVELRQAALSMAERAGEPDSMAMALGHLALAGARLALEDWPGAQTEFLRCLEFQAECGLDSSLEANCWTGLQEASVERHLAGADAAAAAAAAALKAIAVCQPDGSRGGPAVLRTMLAQVHLRAGEYQAALAAATQALAILPEHRGRMMLRAAIFTVQAEAHLALGAEDPGMAAIREAAAILSSPAIPASSRNLAFAGLGELGGVLWKTGSSGPAIDLMRQAVRQLESGGATVTAAQYRIKMAAALRTLGRHAEALYALPGEEDLPPSALCELLAERAELHLAAGRPHEAVADARMLVALWQMEPQASGAGPDAGLPTGTEPPSPAVADARTPLAPWQTEPQASAAGPPTGTEPPSPAVADARASVALRLPEPLAATEAALAEGLLARACLESGNAAEAETLARHSAEVLAAWGHPGAAGCRITLALATREPSRAVFDAALGLIESSPVLSAAEKTRRLEAERARMERFGAVQGSNQPGRSLPMACD